MPTRRGGADSQGGELFALVARIGANPAESEDERIRRLIWVTTLAFAVPVLAAMALVYAAGGSSPAAWLTFMSAIFFAGQLLFLGVRRRGLSSIALVFPSRRRAAWLLVAYLGSVAAGAVLADRVAWARPLPPLVNRIAFGATLALICSRRRRGPRRPCRSGLVPWPRRSPPLSERIRSGSGRRRQARGRARV